MIAVDANRGAISRMGCGVGVRKNLVDCVPWQYGENVAPGMIVGVGVGVWLSGIALGIGDAQPTRSRRTQIVKHIFPVILITRGEKLWCRWMTV